MKVVLFHRNDGVHDWGIKNSDTELIFMFKKNVSDKKKRDKTRSCPYLKWIPLNTQHIVT